MPTCGDCGFSYTERDIREHNAHHSRWLDASERHGVIRSHAQLEEDKLEAWRCLRPDVSVGEQGRAIEEIVRVHFERSVSQQGFARWKTHPPFTEYAAAYHNSSASKHREAWAAFRQRHPERLSKHLLPDHTYWE